jgi:hypothetical protein
MNSLRTQTGSPRNLFRAKLLVKAISDCQIFLFLKCTCLVVLNIGNQFTNTMQSPCKICKPYRLRAKRNFPLLCLLILCRLFWTSFISHAVLVKDVTLPQLVGPRAHCLLSLCPVSSWVSLSCSALSRLNIL